MNTNSTTPPQGGNNEPTYLEKAEELLDQAKDKTGSIVGQAKTTLGDAFDTTVSAVKDNPVAAAAIATGAAAAVAGVVYGTGKLLAKDGPETTPRKK